VSRRAPARPASRAVALRRSIRCDAGGDADTGAAVKDVLDGSSVFLVGMMGTGKSSVGKKLAASLGYNFFDTYVRAAPLSPRVRAVYPLRAARRNTARRVFFRFASVHRDLETRIHAPIRSYPSTPLLHTHSDDIIEQVTKMSIPDIFAAEGEEGFREVETQILAEVAAYKKCVVATGGGIVKKKANWMHLRNGVVVCLSGTPQLLASRVVKDGAEARPLFKDANGDEAKIAAKIDELQSERAEMYANADVTVKLLAGEDGGEGEDIDGLNRRVLSCLLRRIEEDDTKKRLRNEPKPGDIEVTGM
jgi:shikimate kinase